MSDKFFLVNPTFEHEHVANSIALGTQIEFRYNCELNVMMKQ